jgi:hypothetical protein
MPANQINELPPIAKGADTQSLLAINVLILNNIYRGRARKMRAVVQTASSSCQRWLRLWPDVTSSAG